MGGGGGGGLVWWPLLFGGFVPFALAASPPSLSLPTGEAGGEGKNKETLFRAGLVLSGGRLMVLLGNTPPCEAE